MSEDATVKKRCPICGRPAVHATRPFCSKRCADVDLHRWLGGHYAVPVVEEDGAEGAGEGAAGLNGQSRPDDR